MTSEQAQILKIAKTITSAFSSTLTQQATQKLIEPWGIYERLQTLKNKAANDNGAKISYHLIDQLTDIIAFTAGKNRTDPVIMTDDVLNHFQITKLAELRDDQFSDALGFVLNWKLGCATEA